MAKTNGEIKGETNLSSAIGRKRERYIEAMQPLLKKSVARYVGNDKHINIKFNKKGIDHIADDLLTKNLGISQKDLSKLDDFLREALYERSLGLYKDRTDNIQRFYYFKDKNRNLYYHVAEEVNKLNNGRIIVDRHLYAISKKMPKK